MAFRFKNQPQKLLYILYSIITILAIRLPYWILVSVIPACRPRRSWSFSRSVAMKFMQASVPIMFNAGVFPPVSDPLKDEASADALGFVWVDPINEQLVVGEIAAMAKTNNVAPARVYGYWYGKRGRDGKHGQQAAAGEKVLYHIHGGANIIGTGSPKSVTAQIMNGVLEHCSGLVDRAFCIDYRLASAPPFASANPFPVPLLDVLSGYNYLINTLGFQPQDIIVSGDSSGGNIAIALARYLIQENIPSLAVPRALFLMSPTADWACTHDNGSASSSMVRNSKSDAVGVILQCGYSANALLGSLPKSDLSMSAWLAPASLKIAQPKGLFRGMPPICMITGGAEQTLDPMITLRDRIVADNEEGIVEYLEYPDAAHVIDTWYEPERTQALKDLKRWLERVL